MWNNNLVGEMWVWSPGQGLGLEIASWITLNMAVKVNENMQNTDNEAG